MIDKFYCNYCAGVGYEDYPSCKIQCRIPGHTQRHESNISLMTTWLNDNPEPEPTIGRPEGNWKWTGHGWKNLSLI